MFKKQIYGLIGLWLGIAVAMEWYFHTSPSRAERNYQRLMSYSEISKKYDPKVFKAEQKRLNIFKQVLFTREGERLQWRLQSGSSELSLDQNTQGMQLTEHFRQVKGVMQEKFTADQQYIRSLEANDAFYDYKEGLMLADEATIARYELPGKAWVPSLAAYAPFMQGKAERITLSMKNSYSFNAEKFQASFRDMEKVL